MKVEILEIAADRNLDCVDVTLQMGNEIVRCTEIMLFDPSEVDEGLFDEWKSYALDSTEGYTYEVAA